MCDIRTPETQSPLSGDSARAGRGEDRENYPTLCDDSSNPATNTIKTATSLDQQKRNFITIVEANHGLIKSLCNAYYKNTDDQKDVFQDIVLQLWKSFETFRGESQVSTWIYRVSLNTILAKVRKEKKKIETESISCAEKMFCNAVADDDTELLSIVLKSLAGLDKAIVILYLEGYKNKEISQILNLTSTNVSTRMNRLKTELKAKFKTLHYEFK